MNLNSNASDTLSFNEHANAEAPRGRVDLLDLSEDFEVFDGLAAATYTKYTGEVDATGRLSHTVNQVYRCNNVLRREVSERDLQLKEGMVRISDTKFEVPKEDLPVEPNFGDKLLYGGVEYEVVAWEESTLSTRWRLWVRDV